MEIALVLPADTTLTPSEPLVVKEFPAFHCVQYAYKGRWDDFYAVYNALFDQLYAGGRQYNGRVREVYRVVDFDALDQCETDIQIGLN